MSKGAPGVRYAELDRETKETKVRVVLDLDGGTRQDVDTGVGFFDHMLTLMAFHGMFDLGVKAEGDLDVDDHHTVEDVGIVLGDAFRKALVESTSLNRYASNHTPMDEALVLVAVDLSGRSHLTFDLRLKRESIGGMSTESVKEFLTAFVRHANLTLHVHQIAGENDHHVIEAVFKGLGRALFAATRTNERKGVPSTKGAL
ncbi:MAG: imidazoleglycerol-phosphate dehydratase HisB [Fimbriimonadaceae bacterium]|nr:imidazoleglycerol-phosphate dehydratase HisB [Fimbriimonadaceae bacterium]